MQAAAVAFNLSGASEARKLLLRVFFVAFALSAPALLCAQSTAPAVDKSQQKPAASTAQSASQQKLQGATTTVIVHGQPEVNFVPGSVTLGALGNQPLKDAPLSASVVTRAVLNGQVARLLSDVVQNDASVEDDYVPVGYYGDYAIRGFPIDLATGIEIDGMAVAGEQDVPLENKESVEILNGLAGVESGVASGGGLIDYITRPPAAVRALDLATDQRGTAYAALDLGRFFGSHQQLGTRFDLAGEKIQSYMNGTNGWRAVGAGAANWKISSNAILKTGFEYQHKRERDGSGYQLLGGTTVPDIHQVYPSTMLGQQSWAPPDVYDVFNTNARLDLTLPHNWLAFVAGSLSHSLIQDNVIYAYGTPYDASGNVACPDAPAYFFCPDGSYGIYDYRDPGELRIDAVAEAVLSGQVRTGPVTHNLTAGTELFLRSVQQPGFYTADNPSSPDGVTQDGAVYMYLGAENIYAPMVAYPIESPVESAGPRRLWEDNHQASAIVQDRMHLPGRIELIAGGRYDSLRDHNYSLWASCATAAYLNPSTAPTPNPCAMEPTDKPVWLPQYAVTFNPVKSLTLYSNYGVMLSLGPEAPWWADDASQFLSPFNTRQAEIGAKYEPGQRILLSGDYFHMRAPFFYPKIIQAPDSFCPASEFYSPGDQCFESEGRETHNGFELNASGKATNWLRITASAAAIRAVSTDTGTPAFNNQQVIDVPRLRTALFAQIAIPHVPGLDLLPGWDFASRNQATRDDTVSVPSYNVFNLGASYTPGGEQGRVTFHLYANNVTDNRYWSDTGANYGDTFLWLGAPTTVRLDAHYNF
ncbi:MAG: TonB-dependent siderophore receptor [Terracidiphilus sp.]